MLSRLRPPFGACKVCRGPHSTEAKCHEWDRSRNRGSQRLGVTLSEICGVHACRQRGNCDDKVVALFPHEKPFRGSLTRGIGVKCEDNTGRKAGEALHVILR